MDTYFKTDNAVVRLFNEWKKHPKLIVACDFDETVYDTHNRNTSHTMVLNLLKKCKELGFYVVVFTASKVERYPFIKEFFQKNGIEVDGINQNVIDMQYGNNGKIYANIFLDDRAGLGQAYTTLLTVANLAELELKSIEEEKNEEKKDDTGTEPESK